MVNMFNEHVHHVRRFFIRVVGYGILWRIEKYNSEYRYNRIKQFFSRIRTMRKSFEKRKFTRTGSLDLKIEYKLMSAIAKGTAEIINMSTGGLCFLRDTVIYKGEHLFITFPSVSFDDIKAEVRRVEGREVAVQFLECEEKIEKLVEAININ